MTNTNRKSKKMSDAKCIKTRQVYPQDTNHHHTMFGGTLMANIDEIAAITAMTVSYTHLTLPTIYSV